MKFRQLVAALVAAVALAVPATAAASPTITESDVSTPSGLHTLTFTVSNPDPLTVRFDERTYAYNQTPVTPIDELMSAGGTSCFAHGVCRTTVPGCSAFGQHLRTGGTGFGGVDCGYWYVAPGTTRVITTTVATGYVSTVGYGTFWTEL